LAKHRTSVLDEISSQKDVANHATAVPRTALLCGRMEQVRQCSEVILVEGLFDYAVLWQAGFHNLTCSFGTHLNADQLRQLCDRPRTVYLTFDVDANHSGQQAAQQLAHRLGFQGIAARRVLRPPGRDPNSFFVQGGDAQQIQSLLEGAQL
jgi:DNA primase